MVLSQECRVMVREDGLATGVENGPRGRRTGNESVLRPEKMKTMLGKRKCRRRGKR